MAVRKDRTWQVVAALQVGAGNWDHGLQCYPMKSFHSLGSLHSSRKEENKELCSAKGVLVFCIYTLRLLFGIRKIFSLSVMVTIVNSFGNVLWEEVDNLMWVFQTCWGAEVHVTFQSLWISGLPFLCPSLLICHMGTTIPTFIGCWKGKTKKFR